MQPHHQRRVDVVRRTVEAIRHQHARVTRLLLPLAPEAAREGQHRRAIACPDAATLNQHVDDLRGLLKRDSERIQGAFRDF